jgi:hypothetical protein
MYNLAIKMGLRPPKNNLGWADFNYDTWYKKYPSWLTKEKVRLVENTVFLSYFDNKNLAYKYPNPLMQLAFKIYHPIAKFRSENNFYHFMIEKKVADLFLKLNERFNLINKLKKKSKDKCA